MLGRICSPGTADQSCFFDLRCFACTRLCGAACRRKRSSTSRFVAFNALGGIVWATIFGLGGYLLGASIHRIAGPVGWLMLIVAVFAALFVWRYFKHHEERLLAAAEFHKAKYDRR